MAKPKTTPETPAPKRRRLVTIPLDDADQLVPDELRIEEEPEEVGGDSGDGKDKGPSWLGGLQQLVNRALTDMTGG